MRKTPAHKTVKFLCAGVPFFNPAHKCTLILGFFAARVLRTITSARSPVAGSPWELAPALSRSTRDATEFPRFIANVPDAWYCSSMMTKSHVHDDPLVPIAEAMLLLGIRHRSTILRQIRAGRMNVVRIGKRYKIRSSELAKLMEGKISWDADAPFVQTKPAQ